MVFRPSSAFYYSLYFKGGFMPIAFIAGFAVGVGIYQALKEASYV